MSLTLSLMRSAPSEVAATTGSASSDTRRVEIRQLRSAIREPGPVGPFGGLTVGAVGFGAPEGVAPERAPPSPDATWPGFWACWGEELPLLGAVPPCGSGSAEALPSLLKRPCTSVATSGPGTPRVNGRHGVGVLRGVLNYAPRWS